MLKFRISTKLLLGSLIIVGLSLLVLNLVWSSYLIPQQRRNLVNLQLAAAQRGADKIESFLDTEVRHLHHFEELGEFVKLNEEQKKQTFELFSKYNSEFEEVSFVDKFGNEVVKTSKTSFVLRETFGNIAQQEKFTRVKSGRHYIGPVYFKNAAPFITLTMPVVDEKGDFAGAINAEVNISNLWTSLETIKPTQSGFAYLVSEKGEVIAHPDFSEVLKNKSVLNRNCVAKVVMELIECNGLGKNDSYINEKNVLVYVVGEPIISLGWGVIVEVPVSEATAPIKQIIQFTAIVSLITLLWAVVVSILFSRRLTNPIQELEKGAQIVGSGNLDYRLSIKTSDEIEQVSESFNKMAEQLKGFYSSLEEKVAQRTKELSERSKLLEEQKERLENSAILLLRRDLDLREINEEMEKEKETISAERNKLEVIISGIKDAVIVVDLDRKIILFNNAAEDLTGFKAMEVLNKPIQEVIKIYDERVELSSDVYSPIRTDNFEGVTYSHMNLKILGKGDKESFANLISGQIKEGSSINLGAILTLHDVTQERQLEEMKLDFVSMAAHELRTPLTTIRGYLSVFVEENAKEFDKEQMVFLDRMTIATDQLVSLVENILSVSRIERGVFSMSPEPLDWDPVVEKTVSEFTQRAKERNIKLTYTKSETKLPKVFADKLRVVEIINNLIANAISYTMNGGKIKVWTERKGKEVITHIQDTGVGIPKEALQHLFTKFFRVSGKLSQGSKGTGLGLYIAKSITEMHHGKIWVESEPGKGSTFSFSLPVYH